MGSQECRPPCSVQWGVCDHVRLVSKGYIFCVHLFTTSGTLCCSAGDTYLRLLEAAKAGAPDVHVHAFSPLEVGGLFVLWASLLCSRKCRRW